MGQPGHRRGKSAGQSQLAGHEIQRERQHGGGQNLLLDGHQQVLRRHVLLHPFPQRLEKIGLFDVFFPVQRHDPGLPFGQVFQYAHIIEWQWPLPKQGLGENTEVSGQWLVATT